MEALQESRTNLFKSFNREFNALERALKEELARRRSSCVSYPVVSYETGYLVLLYKCGTSGRTYACI